MNNQKNNSGISINPRALTYGLTIGFGVGLATKNWGVGIALAVVFAAAFGAFRRPANGECDNSDHGQNK